MENEIKRKYTRNQRILDISMDIEELNELQNTIKYLIDEQGVEIDNICYSTSKQLIETKETLKELETTLRRRKRRKMYKIIFILLVIGLIIFSIRNLLV